MRQQHRRKQAWARWRKLISQQAKSKQSVAAFCRERELCGPHFFAWKKRLSEAVAQKFVEVKLAASIAAPAAAGTGIEVRLKNDVRLVVAPGFDAHHLQALVAALEGGA